MTTFYQMDTALPNVHGILMEPTLRLGRWALRRRHGVSVAQLRAAAWSFIDALDELLSLPVTVLGVEIHVSEASEGSGDSTDQTSESAEGQDVENLNVILETVRNVRSYYTGVATESLLRALHAREPEVAKQVEERRESALARLAEWESILILWGAGTEEDAHLAAGLVPPVRDDTPGPTVHFEF